MRASLYSKLLDDYTYYYKDSTGTLGYVSGAKAKRMIKDWGWKRKQFVPEDLVHALFENYN